MENFWVIYCASEKGFWNNDHGWTSWDEATRFTDDEHKDNPNLPYVPDGGVQWLEIEE